MFLLFHVCLSVSLRTKASKNPFRSTSAAPQEGFSCSLKDHLLPCNMPSPAAQLTVTRQPHHRSRQLHRFSLKSRPHPFVIISEFFFSPAAPRTNPQRRLYRCRQVRTHLQAGRQGKPLLSEPSSSVGPVDADVYHANLLQRQARAVQGACHGGAGEETDCLSGASPRPEHGQV